MPLPDALHETRTDPLRSGTGAPAPTRQRVKRFARKVIRRAEGTGLFRTRAAVHASNVRLDGLEGTVSRLATAVAREELTRNELAHLHSQFDQFTAAAESRFQEWLPFAQLTRELTENQELLKAEFRALQATLEDIGMAFAPGAGISAAAVRIAELRERVNGLDRRLRTINQPAASGGADIQPASPPSPAHAEAELFDYVGFENRFRGDPQAVADTLWERYGRRLSESPPVVDLGCGQGQLLGRLRAENVPARGIDTDLTSVMSAREKGLEVFHADALQWLGEQPEHSIGSLIATHLIEHLQLNDLVRLLELAATRLVPGGLLIAETPNPGTLIVLGNSFILDPTHVRPVHPSLLTFFLEGAGFRDVRLEFFAPAEAYHLPLVTDPDAPAWVESINDALRQLNQVLFGAQDFAALATTPA